MMARVESIVTKKSKGKSKGALLGLLVCTRDYTNTQFRDTTHDERVVY